MLDESELSHDLRVTTKIGPLGGASYVYRGATIDGNEGGTVFRIILLGAPFDGWKSDGDLSLPRGLVDAWRDHGEARYLLAGAGTP
jgi:hypothetical protein